MGMTYEEIRDRIGTFLIGQQIFENDLEIVRMVIAQVIVIKCEFDYASRSFVYTALSEKFEEVKQGKMAPHYLAQFDQLVEKTEDGEVRHVEFAGWVKCEP